MSKAVQIIDVALDPLVRDGIFVETNVYIVTDQERDGCTGTKISFRLRWNGLIRRSSFVEALHAVSLPDDIGVSRSEINKAVAMAIWQAKGFRPLEDFPTPGDLLESTLQYFQDT